MINPSLKHKTGYSILLLIVILIITALLYWPGLHGDFYLDDSANLSSLGDASNLTGALNFIFNNGNIRFLSYLTFLPQQADWINQNAFPFKLLNLTIHLINIVLVYCLAKLLCKKLNLTTSHSLLLTSISTLFWALSSIQVSCVLYVIQRMTLLSSLFTLIACISFLSMHESLISHKRILVISIIIGACYTLGIMAKENAILIGIYLLVLEKTIPSNRPVPAWWKFAFLVLPLLLTILFLLIKDQINYHGRHFTLTERLITESTILFEYAKNIVIPLPANINLFNDNHSVITSLFENSWTVIFLTLLTGLIYSAIRLASKYPVYAFSILWFTGGHLLESSIIPLELYFEHRNYLPSFGIIFGLTYLFTRPGAFKKSRLFLLAGLIVNTLFTTSVEINSWSNPKQFALDAIQERPDSIRALQTASEYFLSTGDINAAAQLTRHAQHINPESTHLLHLIVFKCLDNSIELAPFETVLDEIRGLKNDMHIKDAVHLLYLVTQKAECQYMNYDQFDKLLKTIQDFTSKTDFDYYQMHRVFIFQERGMKKETLTAIDAMDINSGTIDQGFFKIYMLLEYGKTHEAQQNYELLQHRFANTRPGFVYQSEFTHIQKLITEQTH